MEKITKRILSGVQPSGDLHLSDTGAIKNFVSHKNLNVFVFDGCMQLFGKISKIFKTKTRGVLKLHLLCIRVTRIKYTYTFNRKYITYTQIKAPDFQLCCSHGMAQSCIFDLRDRAGKNSENVSVGLFSYQHIMAADILIYLATHVPVGEDQNNI